MPQTPLLPPDWRCITMQLTSLQPASARGQGVFCRGARRSAICSASLPRCSQQALPRPAAHCPTNVPAHSLYCARRGSVLQQQQQQLRRGRSTTTHALADFAGVALFFTPGLCALLYAFIRGKGAARWRASFIGGYIPAQQVAHLQRSLLGSGRRHPPGHPHSPGP